MRSFNHSKSNSEKNNLRCIMDKKVSTRAALTGEPSTSVLHWPLRPNCVSLTRAGNVAGVGVVWNKSHFSSWKYWRGNTSSHTRKASKNISKIYLKFQLFSVLTDLTLFSWTFFMANISPKKPYLRSCKFCLKGEYND